MNKIFGCNKTVLVLTMNLELFFMFHIFLLTLHFNGHNFFLLSVLLLNSSTLFFFAQKS